MFNRTLNQGARSLYNIVLNKGIQMQGLQPYHIKTIPNSPCTYGYTPNAIEKTLLNWSIAESRIYKVVGNTYNHCPKGRHKGPL